MPFIQHTYLKLYTQTLEHLSYRLLPKTQHNPENPNWKIDFGNAKKMNFTWSAIIHIFD